MPNQFCGDQTLIHGTQALCQTIGLCMQLTIKQSVAKMHEYNESLGGASNDPDNGGDVEFVVPEDDGEADDPFSTEMLALEALRAETDKIVGSGVAATTDGKCPSPDPTDSPMHELLASHMHDVPDDAASTSSSAKAARTECVQSLAAGCALARPICQKCNCECDPLAARLTSKMAGTWICKVCHCRQAQLSRMTGGFPNAEFKQLSAQDQTEFWNTIKHVADGMILRGHLVETLVKRRVDSLTSIICGSYLPLSVYERQGYDVHQIKSNCSDVKQHAVLGQVYRVAIETLDRRTMEEKSREAVLKTMMKVSPTADQPSPIALSSTDATSAPKLKEASSESSSDSDADSSVSSSSSDKKKKKKKSKGTSAKSKKAKKSKKEKKGKSSKKDKKDKGGKGTADADKKRSLADAAQAKADDKKRKAHNRKIQIESEKVLKSLTHPIWTIEQDMKNPLFQKVASFAATGVAESMDVLVRLRDEAHKKNISNDPMIQPLTFTISHVADMTKQAMQNSAIVRSMMNAAPK